MLSHRRPRRNHRRPNEQGSIVVALLVIFVLVALSSVLAARVIGNQTIVVNRQSTAANVAWGDAAVADALFRIDQGSAAIGPGTSFCVGVPGCIAPLGIPAAPVDNNGAPEVKYKAFISVPGDPGTPATNISPSQATQWTVQAVGTVNGAPAAIQELLTRNSPQYQYAVFATAQTPTGGSGAQVGLNFTGQDLTGFGSYAPGSALTVCPDQVTSPPCTQIGSNALINCNGSTQSSNHDLPLSLLALYYSRGGGINGACGTTQAVPQTVNYPDKSPPAANLGCPFPIATENGQPVAQLGGTNWPAIGVAGTTSVYVCRNTAVSISGHLEVDGPVQFYVQLDQSTNSAFINAKPQAEPTLDFDTGATVNVSLPVGPTNLPNATLLQFFTNSSGTIGYKNNGAFYYGGTIYAPEATMTDAGCQGVYYGSLVLSSFQCNGANLTVSYDTDFENIYGPWGTTGYVQIPPGKVTGL
jgi:hypothetical protein